MKYYISVILFFFFSVSSVSYAEKLFYETGDIEKLLDSYSSFPNPLTVRNSNIITLQMGFVATNQKYYNKVSSLINNLQQHLQAPIIQGLVNAVGSNILANKNHHFSRNDIEDKKLRFLFPIGDYKNSERNCDAAEYLLSAFHVTGDEECIFRILKFLSQFPEDAIKFGKELHDLELSTISKTTNSTKKASDFSKIFGQSNNYELQMSISVYKIIFSSLRSQQEKYEAIDNAIEKILEKNPQFRSYLEKKEDDELLENLSPTT